MTRVYYNKYKKKYIVECSKHKFVERRRTLSRANRLAMLHDAKHHTKNLGKE